MVKVLQMMKVECYPVGLLQANMFVVKDEEQGLSFVVDPGAESMTAEESLDRFGGERLQYILLTHGHFDHIGNAAALKRKYPQAKIVIGKEDSAATRDDALNLAIDFAGMAVVEHIDADLTVGDGDCLPFGEKTIQVLATPGHTRGGVCYLTEEKLFTGDTIMKGTTGRMDFPGGSVRDMLQSVRRIAALEGNPALYCGHGAATTLEMERRNNIAMGSMSYDDLY